MKSKKNADTLLFVLLFTTGQRKKYIKKTFFLWVSALRIGEQQRVLGVPYRNIYQILNVIFQ